MRKLSRYTLTLAVAVLVAIPPNAIAVTTVGQVGSPQGSCGNAIDVWQNTVASGSDYVVPRAGLISSWSTNAKNTVDQRLTFKVLRPLGGERFGVVGHDGPRLLIPSALNTFNTQIQVQRGDILAINPVGSPVVVGCSSSTGNPADVLFDKSGDGADGEAIETPAQVSGFRLNLMATLLSAPTIAAIGPTAGSVTGGSTVTISGSEFAEIQSVTFGGVAAAIFPAHDEDQIQAIAPPSKTLGPVAVVVKTALGAASGSFIYEGCRVPKLRGLGLNAARKRLRAADCRIGRVSGRRRGARAGLVLSQSPKPLTVLAPGGRVNLRVGRAQLG